MSARKHAIAGFVIAALLFSMTHWLPGSGGPVFSADMGVSSVMYDESTLYSPGARRFADTLSPAWELDVIELRDERFSYPITHQIVLGTLARLTGSVEAAFMLAHALLPACVWLLCFTLVYAARKNTALACAAAWTACLAAASPRNALLLGTDAFKQALELTRTPHPALSTALLALAMWGIVQSLLKPGSKWPWLAGPLMGVLFYTYYFHAVAAWAGLGALFTLSLILRTGEWRRLGIIAATGLMVAIPYIAWTLTSMRSGIMRELMGRIGVFERTLDVKSLIGLVLFASLLVWLGRKRQRAPVLTVAWVLVALIGGAFIVANLHLITGYNAQHEHAYNRIIQPFGVLFLAAALPLTRTKLLHGISLLLIALASYRQVRVAAFEKHQHVPTAALSALNELPGEHVIAALEGELRGILPVKTPHWSFVPLGCRTLASNEEILRRFIVVAKLAGLTQDETHAMLTAKPAPGQMRTFCWDLLVSYKLREADARFFAQLWDVTIPAEVLKTRRLDVLMLPSGKPPTDTNFVPMFSADGWTAYKLTSPPAR